MYSAFLFSFFVYFCFFDLESCGCNGFFRLRFIFSCLWSFQLFSGLYAGRHEKLVDFMVLCYII